MYSSVEKSKPISVSVGNGDGGLAGFAGEFRGFALSGGWIWVSFLPPDMKMARRTGRKTWAASLLKNSL